jgi:VanZ family protein
MLLIFISSAQPAAQSNNLSKGVTEIVIETVERVAPKANLDMSRFNHLVRKNAHFFAYLVLGILVLNAMRRSGVSSIKGIAIAFLICVLYAVSDEVHQLFVPGRGGQVKDVLLDSAGAIVGIGMYLGINRIKKNIMV